jgi:hypothetical protein
MPITCNHELAHAAATDFANRQMRATGRQQWSAEDYNAAVAEYHRLNPISYDRTTDPVARRELAASLREIRNHYRNARQKGYWFCKAVLGNFYTGLACKPGMGL